MAEEAAPLTVLENSQFFLLCVIAHKRKNFLFCITPQGAEVSALYYSLVESCKKMDLDPHKYLTYVFNKGGRSESDADWDALVPGRVDISEVDYYYDLISSAKADPERKDPYILRGKRH